jgi:hypothetical protein
MSSKDLRERSRAAEPIGFRGPRSCAPAMIVDSRAGQSPS